MISPNRLPDKRYNDLIKYANKEKEFFLKRWIKLAYNRIRLELRYRKKLKELRKRDPFIYK